MVNNRHKNKLRFTFEALRLDATNPIALFRQLEQQLRVAIWQGRLEPGERLPSTRQLSKELGLARNTVINAYEQLTAEGFINSAKGAGTWVNRDFPLPNRTKAPVVENKPINRAAPLKLSARYNVIESAKKFVPPEEGRVPVPFRAHTPACAEFPKDQWMRLMVKLLRSQPNNWMEQCHPCGYFPLRQAIASYLGAARSISTSARQVVVTAGVQQGIEMLAKLLINPGDVVVFEEPGYAPGALVFKQAGARVVNIPVDKDGLDVNQLDQKAANAKLVYVTPANHFPLGMTLPQSRRKALLQWAERTGAWIIEDDYNGEYQYSSRPLTTLHAMAGGNQVIYMGSFSKLLFPASRLGYMVVPETLTMPLAETRWLIDRHSPSLDQAVLTEFINQGFFARHLRRMRTLYSNRQQALLRAAKSYLSQIMIVPPLDGGLHMVGWLKPGVSESRVLRAANFAKVELMPTSRFASEPLVKPSVMLGYAPYSSKEIHHAARQLSKAYSNVSVNEHR